MQRKSYTENQLHVNSYTASNITNSSDTAPPSGAFWNCSNDSESNGISLVFQCKQVYMLWLPFGNRTMPTCSAQWSRSCSRKTWYCWQNTAFDYCMQMQLSGVARGKHGGRMGVAWHAILANSPRRSRKPRKKGSPPGPSKALESLLDALNVWCSLVAGSEAFRAGFNVQPDS